MRGCLFTAVIVGGLSLIVGDAKAHITISPAEADLGATQTYVMRVPNERPVPTARVEGKFPPGLNVLRIEPKPGWTIEPKTDASGRIVGVVWSGVLKPETVEEFGITAINPPAGVNLTWNFTQYYEGGETVHWNGPPKTKRPAPVTILRPAR